MVMKAEPILRAVEQIQADYARAGEQIRLLFPSPHGRPFTQAYAKIWRPTRVDSSFSVATTRGLMNGCGLPCIRKKFPSGIMC